MKALYSLSAIYHWDNSLILRGISARLIPALVSEDNAHDPITSRKSNQTNPMDNFYWID